MKIRKRLFSLIFALVLLASISVPAFAGYAVPNAVMNARDSVVRVFASYREGISSGSGFILKNTSKQTLIATNYHVVSGRPAEIGIWYDDEIVDGTIIAKSSNQDLCILLLDKPVKGKALNINKTAKQGQQIYCIGFPGDADYLSDKLALDSNEATITDGIISAVRSLTIEKDPVSILQINADITKGNSGGPLLDTKGNVLGINTYGVSAGINGAVSATELLALANYNGINVSSGNPVIYIIIGAAILLAIAVYFLFINRKIKTKKFVSRGPSTLAKYIETLGHGLSIEQAVTLMMPVVVQLRNMHDAGKPHLQISPEMITMSKKGASILPPTNSEAGRYVSGFAAPEVYKGRNNGFATDIYSICAVLFYVITGTVPQNALDREAGNICVTSAISNDDFAEIIKKGMSVNPENRFNSISEIIAQIAPYNTSADLPVITNESSGLSGKSRREKQIWTKQQKKKALLITAGSVLSLLIVAYVGSFHTAIKLANEMNYQAALKHIIFPKVEAQFDSKFIDYMNTTKEMVDGDYIGACRKFKDYGDYLQSKQMMSECNYLRAEEASNNGEYEKSVLILTDLVKEKYRDSEAKLIEGIENAALDYLQDDDYLSAYRYLEKYKKYDKIKDDLNELKPDFYEAAMACFKQKDYDTAQLMFAEIDSYKDSREYYIISKTMAYLWTTDAEYKELISYIDNPVAKEAILKHENTALQFLVGTWKTSNGQNYITFKENKDGGYNSTYNLPWLELKDSYFDIVDGKYVISNSTTSKDVYKFTIIDKNTMEVYCYKNGSTYKVFRQ